MDKIYVPRETIYNKCYVITSSDIIRAYDRVPSNNSDYNYRDYYINSSYIYRDGYGSWGSYSNLPVCLSSDVITNDFYYRLDFPNILVMFLIINIFGILVPIKIFSKIFKKGSL